MIIYKVTNLINGKTYIGLTTKSLEQRKSEHIYKAFNQNGNPVIHRALRKYGENSFTWEVIDTAETQEELSEKEIYWIKFHESFGANGYNLTHGGEGSLGYKHTPESRAKMSISQKGRTHSDETKRKMGLTRKGSKHPLATITESDVLEIKEMIKDGMRLIDISNELNINKGIIGRIKIGETWRDVGDDVSGVDMRKLTEEEANEIKNLLREGELSHRSIAREYGVSNTYISMISRGLMWKNDSDDLSKFIANGRETLNEEKVIEIKILLKENELTQREIAEMYGVQQTAISKIKLGKNWSHVKVA